MNSMSMLKTVSSRGLAGLLLCAAALLGGCAVAPSSPSAMTPDTIQTTKQHAKSVSVAATGGKGVATDGAIADAVAASIEKAKTFSRVIKGAGADYQLTVSLMTLDMPSFGMSFTCKTEMAWSLKRADGVAVWQEMIKSEGTAGAGEAFVGTERAKMAIERSIRDNIAQGLAKISNQSL
ncbi:MAG TPA: hypothetical protein VJ693_23915 [Ideonella sp.]|nr:hypothetical protein [Ideonella sp.]